MLLRVIVGLVCVLGVAASTVPARSATDDTVVTATVTSATKLDVAGCAAATLGRTHFGPVTAGSSALMEHDCVVEFGSSNDAGRLRIAQSDGLGDAMWSPAPAALDEDFGTDGISSTPIAPGTGSDRPYRLAVDQQGRIYAGGQCEMGGATLDDLCVLRLLDDGTLDPTFGVGGVTTISFGAKTGVNSGDHMSAILPIPGGGLYVSGRCNVSSNDFCASRLHDDGTLDLDFNTTGMVVVTFSNRGDWSHDAALMPDGGIVMGGTCDVGSSIWDACMARIRPDGSLHPDFGSSGLLTVPSSHTAAWRGVIYAIDVLPDGRIVTSGHCGAPTTNQDLCQIRVSDLGELDVTFGDGGVARYPIAGMYSEHQAEMHLLDDGSAVLAGSCREDVTYTTDGCVLRTTSTGTLDPSFGVGGVAFYSIGASTNFEVPSSVRVLDTGHVLVLGTCYTGTASEICLARFTDDGTLDPSFGTAGTATTSMPSMVRQDHGASIGRSASTLLADGGFAVAANCSLTPAISGPDFCVAAYRSSQARIQQYDNPSVGWQTPDSSAFAACLHALTDASESWQRDAACPQTAGAYWNPVSVGGSEIAVADHGVDTATASIRFAMRAAPDQLPGSYVAPIAFTVVAP